MAVTHDYETVFREVFPRLVSLGTLKTGRADVARDLAQETMLRAHARWDELSTYDAPAAWCHTVMTNLLVDHHRTLGGAAGGAGLQHPAPGGVGAAVVGQAAVTRRTATRFLHNRQIAGIAHCAGVAAAAHGGMSQIGVQRQAIATMTQHTAECILWMAGTDFLNPLMTSEASFRKTSQRGRDFHDFRLARLTPDRPHRQQQEQ